MSGETLQVYFLGTAGALPTQVRNPPCIMIRRGTDTLLFDCGEGAQQQMMRARCGFTVDAIFVTHWHADHFLGIFGLVQTMSFNGRTGPLSIYGPVWVHEFVETIKKISRFNLKFTLDSVELSDGSWVRFDGYTVTGFSVSHGMPALGYVLEEDPRPGRFDRERAIRSACHRAALWTAPARRDDPGNKRRPGTGGTTFGRDGSTAPGPENCLYRGYAPGDPGAHLVRERTGSPHPRCDL